MYSLDFDDFFEEKYSLIGIHTALKDYQLAYLLNTYLSTKFKKALYSLDFENEKNNASFTVFSHTKTNDGFDWFLISNSFKDNYTAQSAQMLLNTEIKTYLIPEKKKIDFFIKIIGEIDSDFLLKILDKINKINQVITSYSLDYTLLKSKEYLIF